MTVFKRLFSHQHQWQSVDKGYALECKCGARVISEFGNAGFIASKADGPNCGWASAEELAYWAERDRLRREESARWSSRNGYELSFYDKDEVPCQTQHAVWGKAYLFNGGWPNHNPGDQPYILWVCCLCGWTTEQRVAADFLQMPGMVVGVPRTEGNLQNAGMVAYLRRVEHLLTHDLKPDPKNSPLQRAERMSLEACNHTCYVLPTPAQFMGC